jgi:dTDP-glucose pyrophosphorylase
VAVGLPDTIWFPKDGIAALPDDRLSFLLFPVAQPQLFDCVVTDDSGRVQRIEVKAQAPSSKWIWGAFKMPGRVFHALHRLWLEREGQDEYFGTLVNAWLADGGLASALRAGERYVDVGTLHGYRQAMSLLEDGAVQPQVG